MKHRLYSTALLCAGLLCAVAEAAPHLPASGAEVIEHLPRRADPAQRELARLRAALAARPNDLALATGTAQRYIATARGETDPRYYGYAQAALKPWWNLAAPPPQARLLRATLLQSTHHFPEALADLDGVIAADPTNAQAWLTRATVQTVRGDYEAAKAGCARLSSLAPELVTITCVANVGALTGQAARSEALLALTLRRNDDADPELRVWTLTLLAEMAARRADARAAEDYFKRALALSPRDSYLLGAYADFLLDAHRPADADALVRGQTRIDALLLRHALALQQLGRAGELREAVAELDARFAAAMQRGDTVHQREQARFELALRGDARGALALAIKNWSVQREPADTRILLEAAAAAHDPRAAAPALAWLRQNGAEDAALARLTRSLGGA